MEVSLEAYRAAVGLFNCFRRRCFKFVYSLNRADTALIFLSITLSIVLRIVLSNDVELNPGPFFKFGHLNARSLNGDDKFDEISELVKENGFDVFAVTETWLKDRVSSDCLQIPGYNSIIRLDRNQRMGGGVAFFTANSLVVKRRSDLELVQNLLPLNFFGLIFASNTLIFSVGFVTGHLIMTVFPLIISLSTFNWFLIKFVNFPNNTLLLCWETSMLITMLQIHQRIVE